MIPKKRKSHFLLVFPKKSIQADSHCPCLETVTNKGSNPCMSPRWSQHRTLFQNHWPPFTPFRSARKAKTSKIKGAHTLGPLQRVLLLDAPSLPVWRRLLPAPCAAQSLRAVLAVQRRRRAHRHIHTVDRDQFWCGWLPVTLGLLVRWRERVWPAENRYTPLGWKWFINVPFQKCALLLFTVLENDIHSDAL